MSNDPDPDRSEFERRREETRRKLAAFDRTGAAEPADHKRFFDHVYQEAAGDAAGVPWADLSPKRQIVDWLVRNPGTGLTALDIACGLGDNAEAMAGAGYRTVAFDLSPHAVEWARKRFPDSKVDYRVANLLEPPPDWSGGFDLVNECYTIQSVPVDMRARMTRAVASLVKPGGRLLVYARTRLEGSEADGPPWPLSPSEVDAFRELGLAPVSEERFELARGDRIMPHVFAVWRRG